MNEFDNALLRTKKIKNPGRHARTKGHSFERLIAAAFRAIFPQAKRQLEYQLDTCQGVDIANTGRLRIQCKKLKKYAPLTMIREVKCDRAMGEVPVLITAGDNLEPLVALPLQDFLDLLAQTEIASSK